MTKTNKRRRVASVLLALVMLFSLMPSLEFPAHAFWEDYDQGTDCIYCDHYHWGENMCDGCGFCTLSHSNSNTKTYNHIIKHFHRYTAFFYHSGACQGICSKC